MQNAKCKMHNGYGSKGAGVFLLAVLALVLVWPEWSAASATVERYRQQAREVSREIREKQAQAAVFSEKEKTCVARLHQADLELAGARKRAEALGKDLEALATALEETRNWIADLEKRINDMETYAARRMAALYKLQCLGKMSFLAAAGSVTDFFQRKTALRTIIDYDEEVLVRLGREKSELAGALTGLETRKKQKKEAEDQYRRQMAELAEKKAERKALLAEIQGQKRLTLAAIDSLQRSARDLEGKIKSLQLKALKVKTAPQSPVMSPDSQFSSLKGLLKMPVDGKIISTFGRYRNKEFDVENFQSGIDIQAGKGTPIRSVRDGRVLFSDWFKGYGNLLIVDHGSSYYTLYAHADDVYKKEGDPVKTGEVIATVGDTGSLKGPMLHFEVRHHGKPMDPMKWLKNG